MSTIKHDKDLDSGSDFSDEELFKYLADHPDYITKIKGNMSSWLICEEPIKLLKRVVKILREDVGFTKENAKIIQEEFYEDAGEPYETLDLIEKFLKRNGDNNNGKIK